MMHLERRKINEKETEKNPADPCRHPASVFHFCSGTFFHSIRRREVRFSGNRSTSGNQLEFLSGCDCRAAGGNMPVDVYKRQVDMCFSEDVDSEEWDLHEFNSVLRQIIPIEPLTAEKVKGKKKNEMKHLIKEEAVKLYEAKESEFPEPEQLRELERVILLKSIDSKWMDHIDDMEILRQGIGLTAYGQRDPVVEYKMAAFDMFNSMITSIQEDLSLIHI